MISGFPEVEFWSPKKFFSEYDPNRTGKVTWNQYWAIKISNLEKELEGFPKMEGYKKDFEAECLKLFKKYDKNTDGIITPVELESFWE